VLGNRYISSRASYSSRVSPRLASFIYIPASCTPDIFYRLQSFACSSRGFLRCLFRLRRRNTRYKTPQLVAQLQQIWCVTSWEVDEDRATKPNLLLKVDQRSTFRNKFLQPATNGFVARQVDHARWKTRNIDQTCNETMLRDKLRVFESRISPPLVVHW